MLEAKNANQPYPDQVVLDANIHAPMTPAVAPNHSTNRVTAILLGKCAGWFKARIETAGMFRLFCWVFSRCHSVFELGLVGVEAEPEP